MDDREKTINDMIEYFGPIIENLIRKYKNIINLEPEDLKQEAYLKIIVIMEEKQEKLGDKIYPYISVCLKNLIMDLIRETSRQKLDLIYDDMKYLDCLSKHIRPSLKDLLDGLNDEEATIACLYMDGLYQEEIGKLLGLSQQTISNRLKGIRDKIRKNI
jgi:RNA polymerase sigma factor (sigma-70 family)